MDYKIGDKVVYPNHGVGIVEQISYGVLNGRTERYFMIRIVSSGLRVMVPQSNAMTVGLRSVIRSAESSKVLGFLETGKLNSHHDWKHRFKENSERMRTDRKSTRLNSSHLVISYAVFCLKKKKQITPTELLFVYLPCLRLALDDNPGSATLT